MEALEDGALGSNMGVGPGFARSLHLTFITPHQALALTDKGQMGTQVSSECGA